MMRSSTYLIYLYIGCTSMFVSCKSKYSNDNPQNADTSKIKRNVDLPYTSDSLNIKMPRTKTFTYDDEFVSGLYTIVVTTYYINDTLSDREAWEARQWPIVQKQKITFNYKDSVCSVFNFPTKQISRQTNKGRSVKAAEIIIWDVYLIEGKETVLFGIREAAGICIGRYCPTYNGIFKLDGTPLYQIYKYKPENETFILGKNANKKKLTKEEFKYKTDSIHKIYGISGQIINNSQRREVGLNKF